MLKTRLKINWRLIVILVIAVFFRFFRLTQSPPELNWDEVSIGYNAYSILKTGKDEWGKQLPLFFRAYGEYKLPGLIYASIPAVAVLGLSEVGVRLTPALAGVIAVYVIHLLGQELFDRKVGLAAGLLLALSPWHIHLSRASFEAGLALLLLELGILYFVRWLKKPTTKLLILTTGAALLSLYTYNSIRVLLPLLVLSYAWLFSKQLRTRWSKKVGMVLIMGMVLSLPAYWQLMRTESLVRLKTLSLFHNQGFIQQIGESRGYTPLPPEVSRLIHNKYTHAAHRIMLNYLKTFSSEFLFFEGSKNTQRSVQGMGLLYLFELPLLVLGLKTLQRRRYKWARLLIYPWILLAPLPSAITIDAPSALRSLNLLPPLLLIEALGVTYLLKLVHSRSMVFKLSLVTFAIWNVAYFGYRLFYVYPVKYASDWQWGYRQAVEQSMKFYPEVDGIYFTTKYGEPYMYVLFYSRYNPELFQKTRVERVLDKYGWVHVVSFDKFYFTDFVGLQSPKEVLDRYPGKYLFVGGFAQLPNDERLKPAFLIRAPNWVAMFDARIGESR